MTRRSVTRASTGRRPAARFDQEHHERRGFPLADFAVAQGRDIPLPEMVEDIASVIGRHAAVRLVEAAKRNGRRWWRGHVYVPQRVHEAHPLTGMIGLEAARALARTHSRMVIEIPQCRDLVEAFDAHLARQWHDDGLPIADIAETLSRSKRAVTAMVAPEAKR